MLTSSAVAQTPAESEEIAQLETQLFDRRLDDVAARQKIEELFDPAKRQAAATFLSVEGQTWQQELCERAAEAQDSETAGAFADVIHSLDQGYRPTPAWQRLAILYKQEGAKLLPNAWSAWRKDPLDVRATAQIMAVDPQTVWDWLATTGDRRDPARYLLLRMREQEFNVLTYDAFVRRHIMEQPASTLALVLHEVCPTPLHYPNYERKIHVGGVKRLVGRTAHHAIEVMGQTAQTGVQRIVGNRVVRTPLDLTLPLVNYVQVHGRLEFTHQTISQRLSGSAWHLRFASVRFDNIGAGMLPKLYSYKPQLRTSSRPEQLAALPIIESSPLHEKWQRDREFSVPEWLRPIIAERFHAHMEFTPDTEGLGTPKRLEPEPAPQQFVIPTGGATSSAAIAAVPADAVGLLALPPRVQSRIGSDATVLAQLAMDRLLEEIDGAKLAQVVDRRQLEQMVFEKSLAGDSAEAQALTGYDVMLRLDVDATQVQPQASFTWVHSSTGSLLASRTTAWPLTEAEVPELITATREAIAAVGRVGKGKLRVRLLGTTDRAGQGRLKPLSHRLLGVLESSLLQSDGIVVMQHLEAGSAREESLLQLMGMSRLPGERTFSAATDVSIQIDLQEQQAEGKSFAETPLKLNLHVTRAGTEPAATTELTCLVQDVDQLAVQAWERIAAQLTGAKPQAAAALVDSHAARRKQAEAELTAAATGNATTAAQRLARADAALTIDPTYEAAQIAALQAMRDLLGSKEPIDPALPERAVRDALLFQKQLSPEVRAALPYPTRLVPLEAAAAAYSRATESTNAAGGGDSTVVTAHAAMTSMLQELLKLHVAVDPFTEDYPTLTLFQSVYRGLTAHGVPLPERRRWVDEFLALVEAQAYPPNLKNYQHVHELLVIKAAGWALEEKDHPRAVRLTETIRARAGGRLQANDTLKPWLVLLLASLDDTEYMQSFAPVFGEAVPLDYVHISNWPKTPSNPAPPLVVPHRLIQHRKLTNYVRPAAMAALTATADRLYVVVTSDLGGFRWQHFDGRYPNNFDRVSRIGWLSLSAEGAPVGRPVAPTGDDAQSEWDDLQFLPEPEGGFGFPFAGAYVADRLCLITRATGLLIFDPQQQTWSRRGADQGLPADTLYSIQPLDGNRVLLTGTDADNKAVQFTHDVAGGESVLLRRSNGAGDDRIKVVHKEGDAWHGWTSAGLRRNLLTADSVYRPFQLKPHTAWPLGAGTHDPSTIDSVVAVDGRWFVANHYGLHEVDAAGAIVRSWYGEAYATDTPRSRLLHSRYLTVPASSPARGANVVLCERQIVFSDGGLMFYAPHEDTWRGPVGAFRVAHGYTSGTNLWLTTAEGIVHMTLPDALAAAEKAGRVFTTAEYASQQAGLRSALPLLDQAKMHYELREFDQAVEIFEAVLVEKPASYEALELLGDAHYHAGRFDAAVAAYDRQAQHSVPRVAVQGLYKAAVVLYERKDYPVCQERIDRLTQKFPQLSGERRTTLDKFVTAMQKAKP